MTAEYTFAPENSWVLPPTDFSENATTDLDHSSGTIYKYVDYQTYLAGDEPAAYTGYCETVITSKGTSHAGELVIRYIPGVQHVAIHRLQVHRDGKIIDKTKTCHIKVEQVERSRGEETYQGYKSLTIMLDDIRVGDEVHSGYTLYGADPAARGHMAAWIFPGMNNISGWYRHLVTTPAGKKLNYRNHLTEIQPEVTLDATRKIRTYTWFFTPEEVPPYEEDIPQWYEYRPYIEISDYASWSQVVEVIRDYYEEQTELPKDLMEQMSSIKDKEATLEEQVIQCLLYVQNEIRYLSLQEPHLTYRPGKLADIVANGFGDCKDKTLLLLKMLRNLGVEAYPALICMHTPFIAPNALPSFKHFDHIIVYAIVNDKPYWFDSTALCPVTNLEARAIVNIGDALILRPGEDQLTRLPLEFNESIKIVTEYDFREAPKGPVKLTITRTFSGKSAEQGRYKLQDESLSSMTDYNFNYLRRSYADLELAEQMQAHDDIDKNILTLIESYRFPNLGTLETHEDNYVLRPMLLRNSLTFPSHAKRCYPYALYYPDQATETLRAVFAKFEPQKRYDEEVVNSPVFRFKVSRTEDSKLIEHTYEYTSLRDHVLPEEMDDYKAKIDQARDNLGFLFPKNILSGKWRPGTMSFWGASLFGFVLIKLLVYLFG